jgi:hypothetical protein
MPRKSLADARRLFRARKFSEVIRLLEPEVFRNRESCEYFSLLGFSCLQTGDLGGATSYITRAHQLKPGDTNALLGLAAIHLKKAETENALNRWLEVLDAQPNNAIARRGMNMLRKGLSRDGVQELIDTGKIRQLYPPLPSRSRAAWTLAAALLALVVLGSVFLALRLTRAPSHARPGVSSVEIPPGLPTLTENGAAPGHALTERQVRQSFQKVKSELLAYHDNLAILEANRLLLSNASLPVKERARVLKGFAIRPSFTTIRDSFPYSDVAKEPALYDGCAVNWKGKLANLSVGEQAISFDLLVGYEKEKELQGIVAVTLDFPIQLENGIPLEVLGLIASGDGRVVLRGVSIHRLGQ